MKTEFQKSFGRLSCSTVYRTSKLLRQIAAEGLSQNHVLQYAVISFMKKYFSVYLVCIAALLLVQKCSEFHFTLVQKFDRLRSVEECFCL